MSLQRCALGRGKVIGVGVWLKGACPLYFSVRECLQFNEAEECTPSSAKHLQGWRDTLIQARCHAAFVSEQKMKKMRKMQKIHDNISSSQEGFHTKLTPNMATPPAAFIRS